MSEFKFSDVYKAGVEYLKQGISVIPVRDKDEIIDGKTFAKKSPFKGFRWTKYQTQIMDEKEFAYWMLERFDTNAIATICGAVSGNMEAIDVDVKWKRDIAKPLFDAIGPIMRKLRVVKTPSGGWHLLYRISDGIVPASFKLAGREATEEELKEKPDEDVKYFIETRGEHAYVVAPPSLGYTIANDVPVPTITWEERQHIIAMCYLFNEIIKQEKAYTPVNQESEYYDVNPFEDYNKREGANTLIECGWTWHSRNNKAELFTRPGSKTGGEHAAYFRDSGMYFFFTTNTKLEPNKCYNPATVLSELKYNGDKKTLRRELVNRGFGQLKPVKAKQVAQRALLSGQELPPNLGEQAKEFYVEGKAKQVVRFPHGIFWELDDKGAIDINREKFYDVSNGLGFRLHLGDLVHIVDNLIHRRESRFFYDTLKAYISDDDPEMYNMILCEFEDFIERHGKFSIGRIQLLDQEIVLSDTKDLCYKFFKNGFVTVTGSDICFHHWDDVKDGFIWAERIQPRNYIEGPVESKYIEFLNLACHLNYNAQYIKSIIGYLAHEYKDESTSYIIVLTEECPDPKQGGGSGKNVFSNLFKLTTTLTNKPGAQVKFDENFFQSWNYQRIMCISDVPKNFDYLFLKEPSSGNGIMKKLYKDQVVVDQKDMPKFLIQTNYQVEIKDGGLDRRVRMIEFSDYFTKCGGVDVHFGGMFPADWNEQDWIGYDNMILHCIQTWFSGGRKIGKQTLSEGGWMKQFYQEFGEINREFFENNFHEWLKQGYVIVSALKSNYEQYSHDNKIRYPLDDRKMNLALAALSDHYDHVFEKNELVRVDGMPSPVKCKKFLPKAPF